MWYRVGAVTLLLVSAGCLGLGVGSTQSSDASTLPPGVDNGSLNATALVAAHERSLTGVPAAVETSRSVWDTGAGGENETVTTRTLTDGNGTVWQRQVTEHGGTRSTVERWDDGTRSLRHDPAAGETVSVDGLSDEQYRTARLETWLSTGQYELAAVESGPTTRYVLTATAYTPPDGEPLEADTVRYEATAVVTAAGRVTAMSATLVTVETNRWGRQVRSESYSYRVARTGDVTPTSPDWLPEEGEDA